MDGADGWLVVAAGLGLAGYAAYLVGLRRHLVEPNRASWLIWAAAAVVEAATYAAANPRQPQAWVFGASALACCVVTASLWRRSRWRPPSAAERWCMAAALVALTLWIACRQAFWAHLLVVASVPVSFWPTWAGVWEDRARERSPAWGWWTLGDLAVLLAVSAGGRAGVASLAYVLVELGCHGAVWFMVGLPSVNPWRSLGRARRGLVGLDAARAGNPFTVARTHLGKAVFAARPFAAGDPLVRFTGPVVDARRAGHGRGTGDRYVQVGPDRYLGPSGRIDDLVNHSCQPNAGLHFDGDRVVLVALRAIPAGEEVCWDYATTLADPDWRLPCDCRSAGCRGTVAAFATLPAERQDWYLAQGVVAPYLRPPLPVPLGARVDQAA